jgi:hypothetical protein
MLKLILQVIGRKGKNKAIEDLNIKNKCKDKGCHRKRRKGTFFRSAGKCRYKAYQWCLLFLYFS